MGPNHGRDLPEGCSSEILTGQGDAEASGELEALQSTNNETRQRLGVAPRPREPPALFASSPVHFHTPP